MSFVIWLNNLSMGKDWKSTKMNKQELDFQSDRGSYIF